MMTNSTKIEDELGGTYKFWVWKYRVLPIMHELKDYVKGEVASPKGDENKSKAEEELGKIQ